MSAHDLTRDGLVRALSAAVVGCSGLTGALRDRAEVVAERARTRGLDARIASVGAGRHAVTVSGPGLFARAFGSRDAPADGIVAEISGVEP